MEAWGALSFNAFHQRKLFSKPWVNHEIRSLGGDQHFFFFLWTRIEQKRSEYVPGCKRQTPCFMYVCLSVHWVTALKDASFYCGSWSKYGTAV